MIYTCKHCSTCFPTVDLERAIKKKDTFLKCKYCGEITELQTIQSSHIANGFNHLAMGKFGEAVKEFTASISDSRASGRTPSPDAHLGVALAQFSVQTVFSEDDPNKMKMPQLICHARHEGFFSDSPGYINAYNSENVDVTALAQYRTQIERYKDEIDAVLAYYDDIAGSKPKNFTYGAFIAYEDEPDDEESRGGYEKAIELKNSLPDGVKNVFLPDIESCDGNKAYYEAEILYAIDHARCMIVMADNQIAFRLMNTYLRYYHEHGGRTLGFMRYLQKIPVNLPDGQSKNVFGPNEIDSAKQFVCEHNNISVGNTTVQRKPEEKEEKEKEGQKPQKPITSTSDYVVLSDGLIAFGRYPQKKVNNQQLADHFKDYGRPMPTDYKGWDILLRDKQGNPYTWYRDEEIDGKLYRAICFLKYREPFSFQKCSKPAINQKSFGYTPLHIYCFEFQPLIWERVGGSANIAELVCMQGVDAREYNANAMDNEYDGTSLKLFLTEEFYETAFNERQKQRLCVTNGGDSDEKVFLLDSPEKVEKRKFISGTDYFRCLGGSGSGTGINSFWVKGECDYNAGLAVVGFPGSKKPSTQHVDSTSVAVVPRVLMRL